MSAIGVSFEAEDRGRGLPAGPRRLRVKQHLVALAASLIINAAFVLAMIAENQFRLAIVTIQEIPVQVIVELPPAPVEPVAKAESPRASPPSPPSPPPPRSDVGDPSKNVTSLLPTIADDKREQKAIQGDEEKNGSGTDKTLEGSTQDNVDKQGLERVVPDPNKEISRLIPPVKPGSANRIKPQIASAGALKRPAAVRKKPDQTAVAEETAAKGNPTTCGANALLFFPSQHVERQGQVTGILTTAQATEGMQRTQSRYDMLIDPKYLYNIRLSVHPDGSPEHFFVLALLLPGLSAHVGDRIDFVVAHRDPSLPCHYIPNLVARVL